MSKNLLMEDQIQGICEGCLVNKQAASKRSKLGFKRYLPLCTTCTRVKYNLPKDTKKPYYRFKKDTCQACGFIPKHLCQLDVHHIDGNHNNNSVENLTTLCANCHRLEHKDG